MAEVRRRIVDKGLRLTEVTKALKLAAPALSKVEFVPALCNFLITQESVTSFNGCLGISVNVGLADPCLIPGQLSLGLLGSLPNKRATVRLKKSAIEITAGTSNITIPTMGVEEFAVDVPSSIKKQSFAITPKFIEALSLSLVAAGRDATFPELLGVSLMRVGGEVVIYASDNYLLSRAYTGVSSPAAIPFPVILPTEFCTALLELVDEYDPSCADTRICVTSTATICEVGEKATIFTQCIDSSTLPDFIAAAEELAPEGGDYVPVPEEMLSILDRSKLLVPQNVSAQFTVSSEDSTLTFLTETSRGRAEECCKISGTLDDFEIVADPTLLAKVLSTTCTIGFHENAVIVKPSESHVFIVSLLDTA